MSMTAAEKAALSDPTQGPAPQLARALLEAKAGQLQPFRTRLEKEIAKGAAATCTMDDIGSSELQLVLLLEHVEDRIKMGLHEAWLGPQGYGWRPPAEIAQIESWDDLQNARDSNAAFASSLLKLYDDADEKWARAVTELFLFMMYGGPDIAYSRPVKGGVIMKASEFFKDFPKYYPLSAACQQLATFLVLARGGKTGKMPDDGLSCSGGSAEPPAFPKGRKLKSKGETNATSKLVGVAGPGDALFFNFHGVGSTDQNAVVTEEEKKKGRKEAGTIHVASVLRTWGQQIQYFDTGVMVPASGGTMEGGTTDHDWAPESLGAYTDSVGLGVQDPAGADLATFVEKVEKARPVGIARLVIFDEKPRDVGTTSRKYRVRYASRFLHLWDGEKGVHISKLVWSVKTPPSSGLGYAWWVWIPKGDLAKRFSADDATGKTPEALLQGKDERDRLYNCNIVFAEPGGVVHAYRRFEKTSGKPPLSGWSRDFGTQTDLPADSMPWVAVRPAGSKAPDKQIPAEGFSGWAERRSYWAEAYILKDPDAMAGETSHEKIDVPFFDQGL